MVKRWRRVPSVPGSRRTTDPTTADVGGLLIGSLFDDPDLRRAIGLDDRASAPTNRAIQPDGRTASMLRAAQLEHAG